jgi:hypothetical protein
MQALSASELLDVWERGLTQSPAQRALTLLGAACPEIPPESLTRLSVGDRDARLTTLRKWIFGPQLVCIASCAQCDERLELSLNTDDLPSGGAVAPEENFSLSVDGYDLVFRLPNSADLVALRNCKSVDAGRRVLLERCISTAEHQGERITTEQMPASVRDALIDQMGQIDESGDVQLELNCPQCSHVAQTHFDIESFFWKEINAWANRILREVHTLASAYGWSEIEILNMTSWRRQVYLNLIRA